MNDPRDREIARLKDLLAAIERKAEQELSRRPWFWERGMYFGLALAGIRNIAGLSRREAMAEAG